MRFFPEHWRPKALADRYRALPRGLRDILTTVLIFAAAIAACTLLAGVIDDNNPFAASVFILAVALTARFTSGYAYGVAGAIVGVLCANYMFTYPFWEFNVSIAGYPLTFSVMMIVSLTVSTLTSQIKWQEQLRFEADREKMRANLLRSVAHDLRTPLTSILGASTALMDEGALTGAERAALSREINRDAEWLIRVMENILSVTKLSGENVTLHKEAEVVEEIVGSAIVKFRRTPGSLPVIVHKPDEILLVPMEATLIEQLLINLFENSVMHGGGATRIDLRIAREPGRVSFCVEDDGRGIAPQVLPHIFDGRAHEAAAVRSDGRRNMGIGLSVCRSIVLSHGGEIFAYNTKAGGAGIRFWLPREEGAHDDTR